MVSSALCSPWWGGGTRTVPAGPCGPAGTYCPRHCSVFGVVVFVYFPPVLSLSPFLRDACASAHQDVGSSELDDTVGTRRGDQRANFPQPDFEGLHMSPCTYAPALGRLGAGEGRAKLFQCLCGLDRRSAGAPLLLVRQHPDAGRLILIPGAFPV